MPPKTPTRTRAPHRGREKRMSFESLKKQLEWFKGIGVEQFNFCVLTSVGMLHSNRSRDVDEVHRSASWAWAQNISGSNVYIRPARGTEWPVLMLDDLNPQTANKIWNKYSCLAVETSHKNYQIWIKTSRSLDEQSRAVVQSKLCCLVGADPGSTSGEHFGRAAGFKNQKQGRHSFMVDIRAAVVDRPALNPSPFLTESTAPSPQAGGSVPSSRLIPRHHHHPADGDQSAVEFRFALARLRVGDRPNEIAKKIASRALDRGKRRTAADCEDYAVATVKKAAAYL